MKSEYIKYPNRRRQILDFSTLRDGTRYPTDIDCLVEWRDRAYILIEVKHEDAQVPQGQLIALRTMADDFEKIGKPTLVLFAEHYVDDPNEDVDVSKCQVRAVYYKGKLSRYDGTVKEIYNNFIRELNNAEEC